MKRMKRPSKIDDVCRVMAYNGVLVVSFGYGDGKIWLSQPQPAPPIQGILSALINSRTTCVHSNRILLGY